MSRYELAVFSNPKIGKEAEFNSWYSDQHLSGIIDIPGFASVQRFKRILPAVGEIEHGWLAIYEMDSRSPDEAAAALDALDRSSFSIADALDVDGLACALIEVCGPKIDAALGRDTGAFRLVALTKPLPGRVADFNRWYDTVHMPEVAGVPGFTWAERFVVVQTVTGEITNPYIAIYGMEAKSLEAAGAALAELGGRNLTMTDAAGEGAALAIYEVVTERLTAD